MRKIVNIVFSVLFAFAFIIGCIGTTSQADAASKWKVVKGGTYKQPESSYDVRSINSFTGSKYGCFVIEDKLYYTSGKSFKTINLMDLVSSKFDYSKKEYKIYSSKISTSLSDGRFAIIVFVDKKNLGDGDVSNFNGGTPLCFITKDFKSFESTNLPTNSTSFNINIVDGTYIYYERCVNLENRTLYVKDGEEWKEYSVIIKQGEEAWDCTTGEVLVGKNNIYLAGVTYAGDERILTVMTIDIKTGEKKLVAEKTISVTSGDYFGTVVVVGDIILYQKSNENESAFYNLKDEIVGIPNMQLCEYMDGASYYYEYQDSCLFRGIDIDNVLIKVQANGKVTKMINNSIPSYLEPEYRIICGRSDKSGNILLCNQTSTFYYVPKALKKVKEISIDDTDYFSWFASSKYIYAAREGKIYAYKYK